MDMKTKKIQEHYDAFSPYYQSLWDKHLHHGYFKTGNESKARATQQLIGLLENRISIKKSSKILDIGCGYGSTSIYFAKKYGCRVTGITISPVQLDMANKAAKSLHPKPTFLVYDANNIQLPGKFDIIWSIEMISHLNKRAHFFKSVSQRMTKNAKWCIAAWMKKSDLTKAQEKKFIHPIEKGMIVNLPDKEEYFKHFKNNNLDLIYFEDISEQVKKTWDISLDIIKNPQFFKMAKERSNDFVAFLKSFRSMQKGFSSGNFRYVVMIVKK